MASREVAEHDSPVVCEFRVEEVGEVCRQDESVFSVCENGAIGNE